MIKLRALQQAKEKENKALKEEDVNSGNGKAKTRQNPCEIRIQKDLTEMDDIPGAKIELPNPDHLMQFYVHISPKDGFYQNANFKFTVDIPSNYPYDPPKVHCDTLVYHPNIDWEGHVCLNILRQDWTPVLTLGIVIFGLFHLFLEPNPSDPLNKEAAKLMIEKPKEFERNVKQTLKGGFVLGRNFPKNI